MFLIGADEGLQGNIEIDDALVSQVGQTRAVDVLLGVDDRVLALGEPPEGRVLLVITVLDATDENEKSRKITKTNCVKK